MFRPTSAGPITGADRILNHFSARSTAEVGRGTLFLDEIDKPADLPCRPSFLRVVGGPGPFEAGRLDPVRSRFRARLIAASNRPLDREIRGESVPLRPLLPPQRGIGFQLPAAAGTGGGGGPGPWSTSSSPSSSAPGSARRSTRSPTMPSACWKNHDWPGETSASSRNGDRGRAGRCSAPAREIGREDLPDSFRPGASWPTPAGRGSRPRPRPPRS